jgi:hypothetical protein
MANDKTVKIIRTGVAGSSIKQTPGSCGYQVFAAGDRFLTFLPTLEQANDMLDKHEAAVNKAISRMAAEVMQKARRTR